MIDKRLFSELKGNRQYKTILVVNGVISFTTSFLQAFFIAHITDDIFTRHQSFELDIKWLLCLLIVILAKPLSVFFFENFFRISGLKIKTALQKRAIDAMLRKSTSAASEENAGSKSLVVCEGAEYIDPYFYEYIPHFFQLLVSVPLILCMVLFFDSISFFIMLFTAPILPVFLTLIGMTAGKMNDSRMKSLQRLGGSFLDTLNGMKTLKLFGRSKSQSHRIYEASEAFRKTTMEVLRVSFLSAFVLELAATISTAIIAVSLGLRLLYGQMQFFDAFLILLLAPEYYQPIRQFGAKFHTSMTSKSAANKLYEIIEPADTADKPSTLSGKPVPMDGRGGVEITCKDVRFSYDKTSIPALNNISLSIPANKMAAVVGRSGSGKSTFAAALLRLVVIDSGEIFINGINIQQVDLSILRRLTAYIPQKPFIFHGTVLENIRFSRPEATFDEVRAASLKASADGFIANFPKGYDTLLSEGGYNLSQGEAQRVAIARAILKDSPLVIIDEATSALDYKNERLLRQAFEALRKDRTLLVIAHRLETVKNADQIHVLDSGRIVESGTHDELIKNEGLYKDLISVWEGNI